MIRLFPFFCSNSPTMPVGPPAATLVISPNTQANQPHHDGLKPVFSPYAARARCTLEGEITLAFRCCCSDGSIGGVHQLSVCLGRRYTATPPPLIMCTIVR